MAKLLFKLNQVPDDEANEIRDLLNQAEVSFYETSSGRWGLSFAAIWLDDEKQFEQAKNLLDEYQLQRSQTNQQNYQSLKQQGSLSFWRMFSHSPIKTIAVLLFVGILLYLTINPFFNLSV